MRTKRRAAVVCAAAAALLAPAGPAGASTAGTHHDAITGEVVVFVTEGTRINFAGTRLTRFSDLRPGRCYSLPAGAHVLDNLSSVRVELYTDPACLFPAPPPFNFLEPDYGAHVTPTASFRVSG